MKKISLLLLVLLSYTGVAFAGDSIPDAKIERLLELSQVEQQFGGAIDQMINLQKQNGQYDVLPEEFWEEFSRSIHEDGFKSLKPKLINIYRENYTEAEIDHQITYLENPLTQQIVAKQPAIMQQSMQVGAEWGQELGMKIVQQLLEKLEDKN